MDLIFHEKQEGGLCAQHCLNSLLQGPYYTAVDLASFAQQLDDAERERMSEGDTNSEEYIRFMQQPSNNMNDTGFFSIQVICKALQVWAIDLIPFNNPNAALARRKPVDEHAFICNLQEHWFTIRKLGYQWFNLNSLLAGPEFISDTYLSLLLAQLGNEGYSIFVVKGNLQPCEADRYLKHHPVSKEDILKLQQQIKPKGETSNQLADTAEHSEPAKTADPEEVRRKRMQYFDRMGKNEASKEVNSSETVSISNKESSSIHETEDVMLQEALKLSMKPL